MSVSKLLDTRLLLLILLHFFLQLVTLKELTVKHQKESVDSKVLASEEACKREDLQNQLHSLTEEMAYVKTLYEEVGVD